MTLAGWRTLPPESILTEDLCTVEFSTREKLMELLDCLLFRITMSLLLKEDIDMFFEVFVFLKSAMAVGLGVGF